jgi:hypothetical protein
MSEFMVPASFAKAESLKAIKKLKEELKIKEEINKELPFFFKEIAEACALGEMRVEVYTSDEVKDGIITILENLGYSASNEEDNDDCPFIKISWGLTP